jgi:molybdopterin-guanine dinucleotide biosynthesis protein A
MKFPLTCVLFAGGKSSRMGEDKALLPFGSQPTLTQYQYSRLSEIFTTVYIACKSSQKFSFEANFLEDTIQESFSPTAAFLTAFEKLQCERFFVLSVDAPFVDEEAIQRLLQNDKEEFDATIAKSPHGIEPLCGIYHRSLYPHFQKMQKDNQHKLQQLLHTTKTQFVAFDDAETFINLNRPSDYKRALQLLNNK